MDIFNYNVVMRMPERHAHGGLPQIHIRTIGDIALDGSVHSAMSVGPMINTTNFSEHHINDDLSLGSNPSFLDIPLAGTILFEDNDRNIHLRFFDGRPVASMITFR